MLRAANVRKLQVGRADIDWGKACSGFRVDMKGRGCSRRREGKGRLRLIGTHSASVLPAKEVRGGLLVLRAAGRSTCTFGTYSVTIGLFPLYCSLLQFSCYACSYSMDRIAELMCVFTSTFVIFAKLLFRSQSFFVEITDYWITKDAEVELRDVDTISTHHYYCSPRNLFMISWGSKTPIHKNNLLFWTFKNKLLLQLTICSDDHRTILPIPIIQPTICTNFSNLFLE